jgi:molybdenum cofactor synthesis domain-containing protein
MVELRRLEYTPIKLTDPDEAIELIRRSLAHISPAREYVKVEDSVGRVASTDVYAIRDIPEHDISAMDGIAVRWSDISSAAPSNPARLKLVKSSILEPGCAVRIYTGGIIPVGADTVVKIEQVEFHSDGTAIISQPLERGKNIVCKGSDIPLGSRILEIGYRISPSDIVLLMEQGYKEVEVYRKPRVGLVCVGDEIYQRFKERGLHGLGHAFIAAKQLEKMGCTVDRLTAVPDNMEMLSETISKTVSDVDAVFTIGGSSVGGNDIVKETVAQLEESTIYFAGIQHNPFKSTGYAVAGKPILMLPGHAVSMTAAIHFLGSTVVQSLLGLRERLTVLTQARLSSDVRPKNNIRTSYLVRLEYKEGELLAHPMPWGTNSISHLLVAEGFVTVEKGAELHRGDPVLISLL